MITQTIKRWLGKLFVWWPWQRSLVQNYTQPIGRINGGASQEPLGRVSVDGSPPLSSNTSIAVEPDIVQLIDIETHAFPAHFLSITGSDSEHDVSRPISQAKMVPTPEKRLAFLRYLVQRGSINEGFRDSQLPKQYQCKDRV